MVQVREGVLWRKSLKQIEPNRLWAEQVTQVAKFSIERNPMIGFTELETARGDLRRFSIAMGVHLDDRRYSVMVVYLFPLDGDLQLAELILARKTKGWPELRE